MRKALRITLGIIFRGLFDVYAALLKVRNYKKEKVLFFTDSRGFLLGSPISYKNGFRSPLSSYLNKNFCVDYRINKYKHTTYLDFIRDYSDQELEKYRYIILILGVVDFSPRNATDASTIREAKLSSISASLSRGSTFLDSETRFDGGGTDSIINHDITEFLKERLGSFRDKIILVNTGIVDAEWDGNYWRSRPKNMNTFLARERGFASDISDTIIDVSNIAPSVYTIDNIHYSKEGFQILLDKLRKIIE